jgi:RNA polymerase sigma factor (sigma-70 family)
MAKGQTGVLRQLGGLFTTGSLAGVTDHQLLERFIGRRDDLAEAAFAALVARHGPMVLRVCRSILVDRHDADDAFQATFLLLALKAGRIANRELLANWLYGIALRTSMKARTRAARRRHHELRAAERSRSWVSGPGEDFDLHWDLHQAINSLPNKYRAAIVLCHLQGMSREQAAHVLGCPISTVRVRLMRARQRLKSLLACRNQEFASSLIASLLTVPSSSAVPTALSAAATDGAMQFATGLAAIRNASRASVVQLMKEVRMSLFAIKLKVVGSSILVCGLFLFGVASMGQPEPEPAPGPVRSAEQDVLDLERAWGKALVNRDAPTMDRILAYEMTGTDPAGLVWNKAEYLEGVKSGVFKIESFELGEVKVRVFGDAAVATGVSIVNRHSQSGLSRRGARFTDMYVRRNGAWQCVAWQSLVPVLQTQFHGSSRHESPTKPATPEKLEKVGESPKVGSSSPLVLPVLPESPKAELSGSLELPATPELPKAELSGGLELPATPELPKAELSGSLELPATPELPKADAPKTDSPKTDSPKLESSKAEASESSEVLGRAEPPKSQSPGALVLPRSAE